MLLIAIKLMFVMVEGQFREFVLDFFCKLGCDVKEEDGVYVVSKVPRTFSDIVGYDGDYKVCFDKKREGVEFVVSSSRIGVAIKEFLDSSGKTTILKIDFDCDPLVEIKKGLKLKNCEVDNVSKKHRNSFFSRFSFMTTFRYLNEREQVLNEVYVHDGEVVDGDLSGYNVVEGEKKQVGSDFLKKDLDVAREHLKGLVSEKIKELSGVVGERLEEEVSRVNEYYDRQLGELSNDLGRQIDRIRSLELEMRLSEGEKKEELKDKVERLRRGLLKMTDDDVKEKIDREQEFTLKDTEQKFSLDIASKILNVTVIYYPVFLFHLNLKNRDSMKFVELAYDPLTHEFLDLRCSSCGEEIDEILLCSGGHIVCDDCLGRCSECGLAFCKKCVSRSCSSCGKGLCKNCLKVCRGCSKPVCSTHMRQDCVSGDDRCILCMRACSRCHGVAQEGNFGRAIDGSKICLKCLGIERRSKIFGDGFE
jgi:hypothetical protein